MINALENVKRKKKKPHQATKTPVISEETLVLVFQEQQEKISMDFLRFKGSNSRDTQNMKILFKIITL